MPGVEINELLNKNEYLLYRIKILGRGNSNEFFYCKLDKNFIKIRSGPAITSAESGYYPVELKYGIYNPYLPIDIDSQKADDFIITADLSDPESIDLSIRNLSIMDKDHVFSREIDAVCYREEDGEEDALAYIFHYFYENAKPNADRCKDMFYRNSLFLFLLDRLVDDSNDDIEPSVNCRKIIEQLRKGTLGKFLVNRLIFHKYRHHFYASGDRIWEKSVRVKVAFIEYFDMLLKDDLEKYYPGDYIAYGHSGWFPVPEEEIDLFLEFVEDSSFKFN